jgi:hypothetical protein
MKMNLKSITGVALTCILTVSLVSSAFAQHTKIAHTYDSATDRYQIVYEEEGVVGLGEYIGPVSSQLSTNEFVHRTVFMKNLLNVDSKIRYTWGFNPEFVTKAQEVYSIGSDAPMVEEYFTPQWSDSRGTYWIGSLTSGYVAPGEWASFKTDEKFVGDIIYWEHMMHGSDGQIVHSAAGKPAQTGNFVSGLFEHPVTKGFYIYAGESSSSTMMTATEQPTTLSTPNLSKDEAHTLSKVDSDEWVKVDTDMGVFDKSGNAIWQGKRSEYNKNKEKLIN